VGCGAGVWPRELCAPYAGVLRPLSGEGGGKWLEASTGAFELKAARRSASTGDDWAGRFEVVSRPTKGLFIVWESVCLTGALAGGRWSAVATGSGVLFPLPRLSQNLESDAPKCVSYCFLRSASCRSFSSCSCFCRSCRDSLVDAGLELLEGTRPAKLSLAGVAGFDGGLKAR